jgi:hypothetical protein
MSGAEERLKTPTLHPMIDTKSSPAVMFHFIPER